jgi:hypothetical protein
MTNINSGSHRQNRLFPAGSCPIDVNTNLLKRGRILLQETQAGRIFLGFGRRDVLIKQITEAELIAKQYNENQSRDQNGRWTTGGAQSVNANVGVAMFGGTASGSTELGISILGDLPKARTIFGALGTAATAALEAFGATFATGAAVFAGAWFIPLGRSAVASGTLPGHPDLQYHYDGDEGHFSLYNSEKELLFSGTAGGDGLIRTQDGDVIGRRIDSTVLIDAGIIPDEETEAESSVRSQAEAQAIAATSDPSLCPVPLPDRPGFKSAASMLYQQYISSIVNPEHPMPLGLAPYYINPVTGKAVALDDCYQTDGTPVDAKGPGIARMVQNVKMAGFLTVSYRKQADRQIGAIPGRQIDWYVDEPGATEFFKKTFSDMPAINVVNVPMTAGKVFLSYYPSNSFVPASEKVVSNVL